MRTEKFFELFEPAPVKQDQAVVMTPPKFFPQERDWTCSVACIRTILSGIEDEVPTEDFFVGNYALSPGPYYSREIKSRKLLEPYDVVYGCDNEKVTLDDVLNLCRDGYYVMLESMYNYSHWFVFLGFYPSADCDVEKSKLLVFDPYYNEVRLLNADEFQSMWRDGNYEKSKVDRDFIAIRSSHRVL